MTAHSVNDQHRYTIPQALDPDDPGMADPNRALTVSRKFRGTWNQKVDPDKTDLLLDRLKKFEREPKPEPLSDSIAMEPTGISRRLGQ